jgi:hypothetical protein
MTHQIAMSACNTNSSTYLYLAFLTTEGDAWAFMQTSDGIWHPALRIGQTFRLTSIMGLPNLLLGLGNGQLYYSGFYDGVWSSFAPLPALQGVAFTDFSATGLVRVGLLVVAVAAGGGFYAQYGSVDGGSLENMSQPAAIPWFGSNVYCPSTVGIPSPQGYGISVVLGVGATGSGNPLYCATGIYNGNNINWEPANVPQQLVGSPSSVLVTPGNPYGTLQAILLSGGLPNLVWDSSGTGSNWVGYGLLPSPAVLPPSVFSTVAAGLGNASNLQVVGISSLDNLPNLIWQDTAGNWWPYNNPDGQGTRLPNPASIQVIDLAIGMGGQQFLQVGYIGQDGNIYVNWQDTNGKWGWYGPLP